jgi:signal transduction histidine kinase
MAPAASLVWRGLTRPFKQRAHEHQRRLALLKEVSRLSHSHRSVDRTLGMLVERLRAFYDADACLLITPRTSGKGYELRRAERRKAHNMVRPEVLPEELARLLLAWPDRDALAFQVPRGFWPIWRRWARADGVDLRQGTQRTAESDLSEAVAAMLDAATFITVPLTAPGLDGGRLYITTGKLRAFDQDDVELLRLVLEYTMPVLHNIKLVDQLAADAADAERRRIALDFHDRVIQPYIGLQLGLEAIRRKLGTDPADVRGDVNRLLELTTIELAQLRHLVQGLKHGGERIGGLVPALRRFGRKFTTATAIQVQVEVHGDLGVDEGLASEVFHIVAEGLSNVRRHTQATSATITLVRAKGQLSVQIRNDGVEGESFVPFTPRSIAARTTALGGALRVERQGQADAVVIADIPVQEQTHGGRG